MLYEIHMLCYLFLSQLLSWPLNFTAFQLCGKIGHALGKWPNRENGHLPMLASYERSYYWHYRYLIYEWFAETEQIERISVPVPVLVVWRTYVPVPCFECILLTFNMRDVIILWRVIFINCPNIPESYVVFTMLLRFLCFLRIFLLLQYLSCDTLFLNYVD
jgi:hypothetical protein